MSKLVILKWKSDGKEFEDVVYLMEEDDEIFLEETEEKVGKVSDLIPSKVYFEDEDGLFALEPNDIISISDIPDDMK